MNPEGLKVLIINYLCFHAKQLRGKYYKSRTHHQNFVFPFLRRAKRFFTHQFFKEIYPVFESLDISPIIRLRAKPLRKIRFIVHVNLGKLAKKLRLLGFDTLYKNNLARPFRQTGKTLGGIFMSGLFFS